MLKISICALAVCLLCAALQAESSSNVFDSDMQTLLKAPKTYECSDVKPMGDKASFYESILTTPELRANDSQSSIKTIYYDGMLYHGKPTRIFAFVGIPKVTGKLRVPGIILVHGGGGTAYESWVRLWCARGYAVIAMDLCGCVPIGKYNDWQRHQWAGPVGYGGFDQLDDPFKDQWPYHAVSDVILANSLLRSLPEVDPKRIGITGISWGSYVTCVAASVDKRFRFAVPVYGTGFLGECWSSMANDLGKDKADKWLSNWDASVYLRSAKMPMMWITGAKDHYPMSCLRKSYHLPPGPRTLCVLTNMEHGHGGPGENPEEIHVFADSLCLMRSPLARITGQGIDGNHIWATYKSELKVVNAVLNYSKNTGDWSKRQWESVPAMISGLRVSAEIPSGAKVCYLNLIDTRGCVVSTEYVDIN